jgi:hypothetical protein
LIQSELTTNAHVARFIGRIREVCANRCTTAPPQHWLADSLRAEWARTPELVLVKPADHELIEREIRRGTNT